MQILIAEDNPINQKLVDLLCRKAGYQTRIVPDGCTAVDAIREGAELVDAVRLEWPDLPMVIATGYAELPPGAASDMPKLNKPFQEEQLARVVAEALREAQGARETRETQEASP